MVKMSVKKPKMSAKKPKMSAEKVRLGVRGPQLSADSSFNLEGLAAEIGRQRFRGRTRP